VQRWRFLNRELVTEQLEGYQALRDHKFFLRSLARAIAHEWIQALTVRTLLRLSGEASGVPRRQGSELKRLAVSAIHHRAQRGTSRIGSSGRPSTGARTLTLWLVRKEG
jgi:hypothetical protein